METYQYERIDLASDAIRLLYLNRGYDGHPIECRLFETPLNEGIPYEALSYDCGDSAKLVEITLDGRKAHITENLFEALRHLRLVNRDRILWVDAICINQDDDKERGHQVRQMRTIYRNAEQVIVWLGISTSPIPSLIPSLISSFMDKMNEMHEDLASSSIGTENSLALWENVWSKSNVCTLYGYRLALENLLKRDWFKRVWSIQEVASARRAVVVCGWQSVPTKTFVRVPSMLKAPLTKLIQDVLDVMPGPLRRESWWAGQRDLHTLMVKFESLEAADPRDQIFALLGISSDACDNSTFPPNYEKPLSETLRDAARFLIFGTTTGFQEYQIPKVTFNELCQNIVRLRQDATKWAVDNLDPLALTPFLAAVKIRLEDRGPLWDRPRLDSDADDFVLVRAIFKAFGLRDDYWYAVVAAASRERLRLLDLLLTEHEEFLEPEWISQLLRVAAKFRKLESLRYLLPRYSGTVDGVVLRNAGESDDPAIIQLVLDNYYTKLEPSITPTDKWRSRAEYRRMEDLLNIYGYSRGWASRFHDALLCGYRTIPRLLLIHCCPQTAKLLLEHAIDWQIEEGVKFVLTNYNHPIVGKAMVLRAAYAGNNNIFEHIFAYRTFQDLDDLADIVYFFKGRWRRTLVETLLRPLQQRNAQDMSWELVLEKAYTAGHVEFVQKLYILPKQPGEERDLTWDLALEMAHRAGRADIVEKLQSLRKRCNRIRKKCVDDWIENQGRLKVPAPFAGTSALTIGEELQ